MLSGIFTILFTMVCNLANLQTLAAQVPIPQLLEEVMHNQREMNKQITEYTAINKFTRRDFNDKGELKEENIEVSENYQSSQRNVEVTLSKNGKPLSAGKIEKERKEAVKKLTEDEAARLKNQTANPTTRGPEFSFVFSRSKERTIQIGTFEIFRAGDFYNQRNEQWKGREMIALDFRPKENYQPKDHALAPLAHLTGTVWIDATDRVTAKVNAFLVDDKARKNPAFVLENERQPDGMWLATLTRVNAAVNPKIFNNLNVEWISEKSNYQRFSAQAGEVKLNAPTSK